MPPPRKRIAPRSVPLAARKALSSIQPDIEEIHASASGLGPRAERRAFLARRTVAELCSGKTQPPAPIAAAQRRAAARRERCAPTVDQRQLATLLWRCERVASGLIPGPTGGNVLRTLVGHLRSVRMAAGARTLDESFLKHDAGALGDRGITLEDWASIARTTRRR